MRTTPSHTEDSTYPWFHEIQVQQEKDKQQQKTAQWQKDLTEKKELWANQHAQTVKALEERQKRNIDTLSLELNQEIQALTLVTWERE
eukprot:534554-Amorphochlora_amoeboformis.AAC.1